MSATQRKYPCFVPKDPVTEIKLFLVVKIMPGYTTCLFKAINNEKQSKQKQTNKKLIIGARC